MRNRRRNPRDLTQFSGKPLAETLESSSSVLEVDSEDWVTSKDLCEAGLSFSPGTVYNSSLFLMANPNICSSHLFRADILFDSKGFLRTPQESEESFAATGNVSERPPQQPQSGTTALAAINIGEFELIRTVVRRLIPRNPHLDGPLEQTCHFYATRGTILESACPGNADAGPSSEENPQQERLLVMYLPHVASVEEMPFYHPLLRVLAFLYDFQPDGSLTTGTGAMSVHFLPFTDDISDRVERTLHGLLAANIRLAQNTKPTITHDGASYNTSKDNIIPRHLIQNTYTRLKSQYARELCQNWVEDTEPSKHVFEDLAITSFLIELWRNMYGVYPAAETSQKEDNASRFPGFVDVACGNGLLVYVLLMEGYMGWGFDARRRKSWKIFPAWVQERLKETIYIPKPFASVVDQEEMGVATHFGDFPEDTFIISNHADELTVWTPLMAALACPESPLPFLAIPCCSHSLSGSRYRYPPPKGRKPKVKNKTKAKKDQTEAEKVEQDPQSSSGDLKALRASKDEEKTELGILNSMYGSLTWKTMRVAEEIGYEVEKTILRIPSTRNMGVVGGRQRVTRKFRTEKNGDTYAGDSDDTVHEKIMEIVERECFKDGGIDAAAHIWIDRAKGLRYGQGKGSRAH